ncbi:Transcriptional repressor IclR [Aliiroseovarius pelagivivens]|uniref:Transcriptional repressor IclR n=1 Tax=Aliiroseovarius pelagivivens TaxID=1639690 RepID=A0A2R8ASN1_9RHOB|nr:IclR family transcriptional regulator [Aliiroseovarius pelagivivens]SPF78877.1 Transcriptional repressor IclR [Aliiroseovarius pelagivivens]
MGTITKALTLLTHFSSSRGEIGLANFVRLSGGDKATVRRHLVELEKNGFLEQHPETRGYRLGPAVLRLASVREKHLPIRSAIRPVVDRMAEQLGELVHASLLQGDVMSPTYHADPLRHGLRVIFDEAELLPLHATASGLAILAFGPEGIIDTAFSSAMTSFAPNTVIARSDMLHLIEQFQACGYSFSDQYFTREIVSFGMPFFGPDGEAIGTVAVPVPQSRLTDELKDNILSSLRAGCIDITQSCGGRVPDDLAAIWETLPITNPQTSHEEV